MSKQQEPVRVIGTGVLENGHGFYAVTSSSHPDMVYVVEQWPSRLECLCKDRLYRRRECKHIRAVTEHKRRLQLNLADAEAIIASAAATVGSQLDAIAATAREMAAPERWGGRSQAAFSMMK